MRGAGAPEPYSLVTLLARATETSRNLSLATRPAGESLFPLPTTSGATTTRWCPAEFAFVRPKVEPTAPLRVRNLLGIWDLLALRTSRGSMSRLLLTLILTWTRSAAGGHDGLGIGGDIYRQLSSLRQLSSRRSAPSARAGCANAHALTVRVTAMDESNAGEFCSRSQRHCAW